MSINYLVRVSTLTLEMLLGFVAIDRADEPKKPGWVADASRADFPDRPAAGRLHGKAFTVERARVAPYGQESGNVGDPPEKWDRVAGAVLKLQQGKDSVPRNSFTIFLAVKPGDTVDGKTFVVPPGGLFKQTEKIMDRDGKGWFYPVAGVQATSQDAVEKPRTDLMPKVTMKLTFGRRHQGRLPGKVYLCIDDREKSFVAGSFDAEVEDEDENPTDATQKELKRLEGTWTPVAVESGGVKVEGKDLKESDKKHFQFTIKDGKTPVTYKGQTVEATVRVDPAARPKALGRVFNTGELKGTTVRSIYELDGDTLQVCFNAEREQQRPKTFTSQGTFVIVVYQRQKP